jgi:hypothetical protein
MKRTVWSRMAAATVVAASICLISSATAMSGKYGNDFMEVEFKSSSKAYVTTMGGVTTEVSYEVDGDKIILRNQAGNLVLTSNKDGTLGGAPMEQVAGPLRMQSGSAGSAKSVAAADRSGPAAQVSGVQREAMDVVLAEISKHSRKGPDGSWITLITTGDWAPEHFYRQFREITVDEVTATELSDADRMNGFEWAGEVTFKSTICRDNGEPGTSYITITDSVERQRGQWTRWIDVQPKAVRVHKLNGNWQVERPVSLMGETDGLLSGTLPPASVFSAMSAPEAGQAATPPPTTPTDNANVRTQKPVDTGYLKEMPAPARVLADMRGSDNLDTIARQWGALYQLRNIISEMSEGRIYLNQLTDSEKQLNQAYFKAMSDLPTPTFDEDETKRLGMNSPRARWFGLRTRYELDESFRNELLKRYFSPEWQAKYLGVVRANNK